MTSVDADFTSVQLTNPTATSFEIMIPDNYSAVLCGSVTAGWTQRVIATTYSPGTNMRLYPSAIYTFEGSGNEMLPLVDTQHPKFPVSISQPIAHVESVEPKVNSEPADTFQPFVETAYTVVVNKPRKLSLTFSSQRPGHDFVNNTTKYKKNKVPNYAMYFTFYSEDGFDNDNHDLTFSVALIATKKP